jgi:hypothetical protein
MVTIRSAKGWERTCHVIPREEQHATAIPLDVAVDPGELSVEMMWLGQHIVDGIWITERIGQHEIRTLPLDLRIEHSGRGDVGDELRVDDGSGLVVSPSESLILMAKGTPTGVNKRTLLLASSGAYSSDRKFIDNIARSQARFVSVAPNPFNPSTTIRYALSSSARVKVNVLDVTGRLVATLVDAQQDAGSYSIEWNGRSASGRKASSGVYFVRLNAAGSSTMTRLVL